MRTFHAGCPLVRLAGPVPSAALPDSPAAGHARPERCFVERLALRPQPFLAKPFTRETLGRTPGAELTRSRELATRQRGGETVGRDGAPGGVQARVAADGLVAAARRLQQRHIRNGSTTKGIRPRGSGRPLASEEKS